MSFPAFPTLSTPPLPLAWCWYRVHSEGHASKSPGTSQNCRWDIFIFTGFQFPMEQLSGQSCPKMEWPWGSCTAGSVAQQFCTFLELTGYYASWGRSMWTEDPVDSRPVPLPLMEKVGGMDLRATVNRELLGFFPPWTIIHAVNFWVTGWHPSRSNYLPSTGISQCTSLKWWTGSVCSADRSVAVANSIASPQSKKGENITTSEREYRETLYCSFH